MGGETVTNDVIVARLDAMDRDQREDFAEVKHRLAELVSREVYEAHRSAADARITTLELRFAKAEDERRKADAKAEDERRATRRHFWGAIVIPILLFAWGQWITMRGGKP